MIYCQHVTPAEARALDALLHHGNMKAAARSIHPRYRASTVQWLISSAVKRTGARHKMHLLAEWVIYRTAL